MAASMTHGLRVEASASAASRLGTHSKRRRHINSQAGHALEILGHAIEYLTDEHVHEDGSFSASDGRVQAVQLLIALNRQIYFQCPEVPTLAERFLAILHCHRA
jgi:hypothetical protein